MSNSIPREFSLKKAILSGIAFLAGISMLVALSYNLIVGSVTRHTYSQYLGISYSYTEVITENGFTMLKFSSELITSAYQWGAVLIGF